MVETEKGKNKQYAVKKQLDWLDTLCKQAQNALTHSNQHLDNALEKVKVHQEEDESQKARILQLLLQYRLDCQNVITALLKVHQNICFSLGIQKNNAFAKNLEAIRMHLGLDNAHREFLLLHGLSYQMSELLTLMERQKKAREKEKRLLRLLLKKVKYFFKSERDADFLEDSKAERAKRYKGQTHKYSEAVIHELKEASGMQAYFLHNIEMLTEAIQVFGHVPNLGVIHDHLADLKGPISKFHTALMYGVGETDKLLKKIDKENVFELGKNDQQKIMHNLHEQITKANNLQRAFNKEATDMQQKLNEIETQLKPAPIPLSEDKLANAMYKRRTMHWF